MGSRCGPLGAPPHAHALDLCIRLLRASAVSPSSHCRPSTRAKNNGDSRLDTRISQQLMSTRSPPLHPPTCQPLPLIVFEQRKTATSVSTPAYSNNGNALSNHIPIHLMPTTAACRDATKKRAFPPRRPPFIARAELASTTSHPSPCKPAPPVRTHRQNKPQSA